MQMPGRHGSTDSYRYGFQGQETDDEWTGSESHVAFTYRVHDARLGRFLSLDPLAPDYPHNSPYAFSENNVIAMIELEGLEATTGDNNSMEGKNAYCPTGDCDQSISTPSLGEFEGEKVKGYNIEIPTHATAHKDEKGQTHRFTFLDEDMNYFSYNWNEEQQIYERSWIADDVAAPFWKPSFEAKEQRQSNLNLMAGKVFTKSDKIMASYFQLKLFLGLWTELATYAYTLPSLPFQAGRNTVGKGAFRGIGVGGIGFGFISFRGWAGLRLLSLEVSVGYTRTYGMGLSFRHYGLYSGKMLALDLHTLGGVFRPHFHYANPGIWKGSHHLSIGGFATNMFKYKGAVGQIFTGLPKQGFKKAPLYKLLQSAKF
jgi:RHS repeat-associated protein